VETDAVIAQSHIDRRRFLALVASWSCLPVLGARAAGTGIERLSIIVGGTAGSNTDRTIRAFGTLAQNLLPGTRIDVEDQGGTNGMQALNNLFSASPDTPTLAVLEAAQIYAILEGDEAGANHYASLNIIGSMGADCQVLFVSTATGIKNVKDLGETTVPLINPTNSIQGGTTVLSLVLNAMTGSRIKPVPGYNSTDHKLALMSGEVNTAIGSISSLSDLVDQGLLVPILRFNDAGDNASLAALPTFRSIAKGKDAGLIVDLVETVSNANRIFFAQAGLPAEQVATLRGVFDAVTADPQFAKAAGVPAVKVAAKSSAQTTATIGRLLDEREALRAALKAALACGNALNNNQTCT
jgi:tripartite-type tricarboxylate transporter receptor subunit TctC